MATPWLNSTAKRQLERDLTLGRIPLDKDEMSPKQVYLQREVFKTFPYEQFRDRLRDLRKKIKATKAQANNQEGDLTEDYRMFPTQTHDVNGRRRWAGSPAETLLAIDMKNLKHELMPPKQLHLSRPEYLEFDLKIFRNHIHQAKKTRVFRGYIDMKRQKKDKDLE